MSAGSGQRQGAAETGALARVVVVGNRLSVDAARSEVGCKRQPPVGGFRRLTSGVSPQTRGVTSSSLAQLGASAAVCS